MTLSDLSFPNTCVCVPVCVCVCVRARASAGRCALVYFV